MTIEQMRARIAELRERLQELRNTLEERSEPFAEDSDEAREWNAANEEIDRLNETIRQRERMTARLAELEDDPAHRDDPPEPTEPRSPAARTRREDADLYDLTTIRSSVTDPSQAADELRSRALRAVERAKFYAGDDRKVDADATRSFIEEQISEDADSEGRLARYILATGSPTYKRAFGKYLAGVERTREESLAMESAAIAERALSLTAAAGGYAVPFVLDPTLILTSDGVVNPLRELATVKQITVDEWRGIATAGVTAAYESEATEVADQTPTLSQPTVSTEKAQAWVAASIEINQDWSGLQQELAGLFQDAKDTLEATKFALGTGTNEPFGLLTGATNTVNAAAAGAFTLANLYALRGALPPRYRARSSWTGDLLIFDRVRQFEGAGGSNAMVWESGGLSMDNPARILGKPAYEASAYPDAPTVGNKFLAYGDHSKYTIADRVGMNIEVVPHVFGANRRPTGQRGFYCYWRNGAKLIDPNAIRVLLGQA